MEALGDGRVAHLFTDSFGHEYVIGTGLDTASLPSVQAGDSRGRIAGGTGRYALCNGGTPGVQKITDFPRGDTTGKIALSRTRTTASGRAVRTLTGASTGAAVRPAWDGTTDGGAPAARAAFTWKLIAEPRDGQGRNLPLTGTTTVG
ncbi:hypothetical protein ACWD5V_06975 [Streptomyces sp. NPDC002523]